MAIIFARQPIFTSSNSVYGYELLYRQQESDEEYCCAKGDVATCSVIAAGFLALGVNNIVGRKRAFINFTHNMILNKVATLFPNDKIVVELLESIEPTKEIIDACKSLKKDGYIISLDDYTHRPGYEKLVELADIIKIDFLVDNTEQKRTNVLKNLDNGKITFLAEKVETIEDFEMAKKIGYSLFQGYYFARPNITKSNEIQTSKLNLFQLISLLQKKEPVFEDISRIIEKDVAFTYEILKIANALYYHRGTKIKSIRQAAVRMGLDELKKWALITILRRFGGNSSDQVINYSVRRGKALELVCEELNITDRSMEFFTMGILSMIDVLCNCSMEEVVKELSISDDIQKVLLKQYDEGVMSICYQAFLAFEKGEWDSAKLFADKIGIDIDTISKIYYSAIVWFKSN